MQVAKKELNSKHRHIHRVKLVERVWVAWQFELRFPSTKQKQNQSSIQHQHPIKKINIDINFYTPSRHNFFLDYKSSLTKELAHGKNIPNENTPNIGPLIIPKILIAAYWIINTIHFIWLKSVSSHTWWSKINRFYVTYEFVYLIPYILHKENLRVLVVGSELTWAMLPRFSAAATNATLRIP